MNTLLEPSQALSLDSAPISYKIAETYEERIAAFRLAYHSYHRAGLCDANNHGLRVTPYQVLPTTDIFVAELRGETICTVSLVCDTPVGLPMETIYPDVVDDLRRGGAMVAEVSCLADRRSDVRRHVPVFLELCRWMVQAARHRGVEQLLVAVHPRHARFYRRLLAFEPIGDERIYPTVCDHPAVALCLDFERIDRERPPTYDRFFGAEIPSHLLEPAPMSAEETNFFSAIAEADECSPLAMQHVA
jgi:hypothetical protein